MVDKTELIRQRMARTRESLSMKLDALEDRTLGVVKDTTDAVVNVAETVEHTVESATKAVQNTVKQSAKMLDLGRQVEKHPWPAMGAAVATGFIASWMVSRLTDRGGRQSTMQHYPHYEPVPAGMQAMAQSQPSRQPEPSTAQPSFFTSIAGILAPSLDSLKDMAIGTAVGVVKDMAHQNVPQEWTQKIDEVIDDFTEKIVGAPVPSMTGNPVERSEAIPGAAAQGENRPRWGEETSDKRQTAGKKKTHGNGRQSESTVR